MGERRRCKGPACTATIEYIKGPAGKNIPAQRIRTVYFRRAGVLAKIDLPDEIFVNHYETCPNAGDFGKRGNAK